jgi:hypothetical protein
MKRNDVMRRIRAHRSPMRKTSLITPGLYAKALKAGEEAHPCRAHRRADENA